VDLSGADLSGARIGWTTLGNVDLSQVNGLNTVEHEGPSTIGIETIYTSAGDIPENFLRGAGLPDQFIAYRKSHEEKPIDFNSAFISYSLQDKEFATQLFAGLQNNNVRAWFAPGDLKIEDMFRQGIERSLRLHDKLLLILSKDSVTSDWVEEEVEITLAMEREQKKELLFLVRVDDTVMETEIGWLAQIKNMRHIGDFSQWQDHHAYQEAFQRLLHDLKATDRELAPVSQTKRRR
jgi:hypothetical protein